MDKFVRKMAMPSDDVMRVDESAHMTNAVWLHAKGHIDRATVTELRDWLHGWLGETTPPPLPTKEFAVIEATLKNGATSVRLSRMDVHGLDHTSWQSPYREDAVDGGLNWYTDDDIESFEVLFEGVDAQSKEVED